jgi:hypothetical protein
MNGEGAIIPATQTSPAPRLPMQLWYSPLFHSNRNFRRPWLTQLVSEIGD